MSETKPKKGSKLKRWWRTCWPGIKFYGIGILGVSGSVLLFAYMTRTIGALPEVWKDGFRISAPLIAVMWAMALPIVQNRQANSRRDNERLELQITAGHLAHLAVEEIDRVRKGYLAFAESGDMDDFPLPRFDEFIDSLSQFKVDKLPLPTVIVSLELLRGVLRKSVEAVKEPPRNVIYFPSTDGKSRGPGVITQMTSEQAKAIANKLDLLQTQAREYVATITGNASRPET